MPFEADEVAAAKVWNDAMADIIGDYKRQPERMLANVSAKGAKRLQVNGNIGAADGVRTRDFQNHNLALLPAELQPPKLKLL